MFEWGGIDYSTTERKIGKWVDGSDLYEVTLIKTEPNSTTHNFDLSSYNIKYLVDIQGIRYNTGNSTQHSWPIGKYWASNLFETYQFVDNALKFEKNSASAWSGSTLAVTIRYTKN